MNSDRAPRHRRAAVDGVAAGAAGLPSWALHLPLDPARGCLFVPFRGGAAVLPHPAGPVTTRRRWVDVLDGERYAWHQMRPPAPAALVPPAPPAPPAAPDPDRYNEPAFAVAARLGYVDVADRIGLHTDLLLVGLTPGGRPADVPVVVVDVVHRCGLSIELPQRTPGEHPLPVGAAQEPVTHDVVLLQRVLSGLRRHRGAPVPPAPGD